MHMIAWPVNTKSWVFKDTYKNYRLILPTNKDVLSLKIELRMVCLELYIMEDKNGPNHVEECAVLLYDFL
jgi:hypothetical protein